MESGNALLDDYVLAATGVERPKVCFLPTASGDADHYIVRFYRHFPASRCEPSHVSLFRRDCGAPDPRDAPARAGPDLRRRRLRALDARRVARARARRRAARGVGARRRDVRAERRLAVLVRAGADRLPRRAGAAGGGARAADGLQRRALRQGGAAARRTSRPRSRRGWRRAGGRRRRRAALRRPAARARGQLAAARGRLPRRARWAARRSSRRWQPSTWGRRCRLSPRADDLRHGRRGVQHGGRAVGARRLRALARAGARAAHLPAADRGRRLRGADPALPDRVRRPPLRAQPCRCSGSSSSR